MKTVLVVDDEPKIVQLARDYLEHAGFAVVSASDGIKVPRVSSGADWSTSQRKETGRPETAPKEILEGALAMYARLRPQRDAEAQSAAARLAAMA